MKTMQFVISDELGIHARPAGLLSKLASTYNSDIQVSANGKNADSARIFSLMSLAVKKGDSVTVTASGDDEESAINAISDFFKNNL